MSINPYDTPQADRGGPPVAPVSATIIKGRPCTACGSVNTGRDLLTHTRPNLLYVLLFGWIFLLIRGAFAMRTDRCRDCGTLNRYKSAGSWLALIFLILIALQIAVALVYGDLNK